MKAQAALEYVFLIGAVLLIIISISYYATQESTRTIQMNQANDAVNTLAKAADSVYALGPGSQKYIEINMPSGVDTISISDHEILFKVYIFGSKADIFAETKAELDPTSSISPKVGIHHVYIKALESGKVKIEE